MLGKVFLAALTLHGFNISKHPSFVTRPKCDLLLNSCSYKSSTFPRQMSPWSWGHVLLTGSCCQRSLQICQLGLVKLPQALEIAVALNLRCLWLLITERDGLSLTLCKQSCQGLLSPPIQYSRVIIILQSKKEVSQKPRCFETQNYIIPKAEYIFNLAGIAPEWNSFHHKAILKSGTAIFNGFNWWTN